MKTGVRLNIKMLSYKYRDSLYKDKTVWRPSYLYNGNTNAWQRPSLYWDGAQVSISTRVLHLMYRMIVSKVYAWVPTGGFVGDVEDYGTAHREFNWWLNYLHRRLRILFACLRQNGHNFPDVISSTLNTFHKAYYFSFVKMFSLRKYMQLIIAMCLRTIIWFCFPKIANFLTFI